MSRSDPDSPHIPSADVADTLVSATRADARARQLAGLRPWKPGQSGNPGGRLLGGEAAKKARKLAREQAPAAMRRLIELMDSEDHRVATIACQAVLERAMGKPTEGPPPDEAPRIVLDLSKVSPKQLHVLQQIVGSGAVQLVGDEEETVDSQPPTIDVEPDKSST